MTHTACNHEIKRLENEITRLRAVNEELVQALTRIRDGRNDPAIGGEEPELLEDRCDRYREWIRKDQDDAIVAISRAEQAKMETCGWIVDEGEWHTACGNDESFEDCDPINTGFYTYCPFCGKRIEVAGKAEGRQG